MTTVGRRSRLAPALLLLTAGALARRVVAWSGLPRPSALRHDAAEAVLIGLWGVLEVSWLERLPRELR